MQKDVVVSADSSIQNAIFILIAFMDLFASSAMKNLKNRELQSLPKPISTPLNRIIAILYLPRAL